MKKLLLTLIVTLLTCIGAWAQASIQLFSANTDFATISESSPLILDVNNTSGIKIWVKPSINNYQLKYSATGSVSFVEGSWDWNNDYSSGSNFTVMPSSNGTGKVTITLNDYSSDVATYDLYIKVADAQLATSLDAPASPVTIAPGYSVDVPFTYAPSTAVLTCSEVEGGSDYITYTFIDNVLRVSASAEAVPDTDTKSFTITPKTGSVDGEGNSIEAITILVNVVAPVVLESISLDPSTAQTIVKGSSIPVSVVYNPSDAANKTVNWSSSNSGVAYYSGGSIVANSIGTATITATPEAAGVEAASLDVTVTEPITNATVTMEGVPTSTRVGVTGAKAVVKVNGAVAGSDFGITYSSTDEAILTVDPTTGEITPVAAGSAKVRATLNPNASTTYYTGSTTIESADITVGAEITGSFTGNPGNITLGLAETKTISSDYPIASWTPTETGCSTLYFVESNDESIVRGSYTQSNSGGIISVSDMQLVGHGAGTTTVRVKAVYGKVEYDNGNVIKAPLAVKYSEPISVTVNDVEGTLTVNPAEDCIMDITDTKLISASADWNVTGTGITTEIKPSSSNEAVATTSIDWEGVHITPHSTGVTTITITAIWSKDVNGESITKELAKTFNVTVTDKSLVTTLTAPADQTIQRGVPTEIPVSFAPSTAVFQNPTSDYDKVTVAYKVKDGNPDYGVLVVTAANDAELEHVANITLTPKATSTAAPVTFQVTVAKPKLPVSDIKPKSIFYVGEEYETELVMGGGLTLNNDYTQEYAASDNVAKNGAAEGAISLDQATGKIVALNVGTAHIQSTFTPINSAAAEYDIWSNGMDIAVLPGKYSLDIDVTNHNIEKSDETTTTTLTEPVIKLNGKVQTYDASKYDIEYSVDPAYDGVSIDGNTISITSAAAMGVVTIKAVLAPKGGDVANYEGATAYTQINIEPKSTDKHGIAVTVEGGVLKIKSDYAGAYGTVVIDGYTTTMTPTIDLAQCTGITPTGGELTNDDVINAIKAADKIEIEGLIKNTDMQIFSSWVGGATSNLVDLNMGEATLTEKVATNEDGNDYNANISFVQPNVRTSDANQLKNVKKLVLPHPAAGQTILPAKFGGKWLGDRGAGHELVELVVSEGWTEIGADAFSLKGIEQLSLPNSLIYVRNNAFYGHHMRQLFLPPNVDVLESYAFVNDPSTFEDVFFTGRTAPTIVHTDAFSSATQIANNSVAKGQATAEGTITRNAYKDGQNYTCMMHYPAGLTPAELATYVDPTRVYNAVPRAEMELDDKSGNGCQYSPWSGVWDVVKNFRKGSYVVQASADGKIEAAYLDPTFGTSLTWPSQQMMESSYAIAGSGYHWDGTQFNAEEMARQGIYQFVLARGDASKAPEDYIFENVYNAGLWWSICVPFNMTVDQIKSVFGENTQVVRFSKVIRDPEANEGLGLLRLEFKNSVMGDSNGTGNFDGYTGILAHRPYMIKPSADPAGEYSVEVEENGVKKLLRVLPGYEWITGALIPESVEAVDADGNPTGITYTFTGNHSGSNNEGDPVYMPQYSYFLSAYKDTPNEHQFFFQKGTKGKFNAHTAIVKTDSGADDAATFFTTTGGVKFSSIFGFMMDEDEEDVDEEATGVENIELVYGNDEVINDNVYTINGTLVKGNNLKPGLYIKNGKKFIVK